MLFLTFFLVLGIKINGKIYVANGLKTYNTIKQIKRDQPTINGPTIYEVLHETAEGPNVSNT